MSDEKHEKAARDGAEGSAETGAHGHGHGHGPGKLLPDDSPPQNNLILISTVVAVASLVGIKYTMDWFLDESRREVHAMHLEQSHSSDRLATHREQVREALEGGERPIDSVIEDLAERGRGAFPQVRPYPSEDRGAREGWTRRAPVEGPVTPEPDVR